MNTPKPDLRQRIALFRYGLVSQLLPLTAGSPLRRDRLSSLSTQDHTIPGSHRLRVAEGTLREWVRAYGAGGFEALVPRARTDQGQPRRIAPELAERLIAMKEANPALSIRLLIEELRRDGTLAPDALLPVSTVHRLFQKNGLMRKNPGEASGNDRRRFAFARAGQLWTSDVMHGPSVTVAGRGRRKTYLIAFLDDATRVVTHAGFTLSENTATFLPLFKRAIIRRGLPDRLYVDNGANYRSHHLALVCAKLGVALIHSRPHQPEGRGKIERFFRTVRAQLLTRLNADDTTSLEAINRRLSAWVEGEYHQSPHAGLEGATPLDRWAQVGDAVRYPAPDLDLDDLFLFEAVRKVATDRTVSLNGVVFEVDAALVGERVTLRFDPSAPNAPVEVVHAGRVIERARRVDLYANCFVKRHRPSGRLEVDESVQPVDDPQDTQHDDRPPTVRTSPLTMAALARSDDDDADEDNSDDRYGRDRRDGSREREDDERENSEHDREHANNERDDDERDGSNATGAR